MDGAPNGRCVELCQDKGGTFLDQEADEGLCVADTRDASHRFPQQGAQRLQGRDSNSDKHVIGTVVMAAKWIASRRITMPTRLLNGPSRVTRSLWPTSNLKGCAVCHFSRGTSGSKARRLRHYEGSETHVVSRSGARPSGPWPSGGMSKVMVAWCIPVNRLCPEPGVTRHIRVTTQDDGQNLSCRY